MAYLQSAGKIRRRANSPTTGAENKTERSDIAQPGGFCQGALRQSKTAPCHLPAFGSQAMSVWVAETNPPLTLTASARVSGETSGAAAKLPDAR